MQTLLNSKILLDTNKELFAGQKFTLINIKRFLVVQNLKIAESSVFIFSKYKGNM